MSVVSLARVALLAGLAAVSLTGCSKRASVWIARQDHQELAVESAKRVIATTQNGVQTATGVENTGGKVVVDASIRAGGTNRSDAQAALEAIVVTVARDGEAIDVRWAWKTEPASTWEGEVSFDIKLPPTVDVKLVTHNGAVSARDLAGACLLETHNGDVEAHTRGAHLDATSHNGAVNVTTTATDVLLETHNGGIGARFEAAGDVGGKILTANGGIALAFGPTAATHLDCVTVNGRIHCSQNLEQASVTSTNLQGSIRGGKKTLHLETRNGSIKIQ
jgi:hypothetical protein